MNRHTSAAPAQPPQPTATDTDASTGWHTPPDEAAGAAPTTAPSPHPSAPPATQLPRFSLESGLPESERLAQLQRDVAEGDNPLLCAAGVLLRALADIGCRLPNNLPPEGVAALHELLRRELEIYTRLCDRANLRRDHVLAVRFALCTALDEAASRHTWGGGQGAALGPWAGQSLLHLFHQEGNGGEKVFLLIGRLAAQPDEHVDVLEVLHHITSLGFEGPYRLDPDGRRKHEAIRHRLYTLVAERRPPVPQELSPQWRGVQPGRLRLPRRIPVWVTVVFATVTVAATFFYFQWDLQRKAERVQAVFDEIAAMRPPERQPVRLADLLKADIAAGRVAVADAADGSSTVTFAGDEMFAPGQPVVARSAQALVVRVGEELARLSRQQPLAVTVTGHSDNLPIATPQFADNTALSLARAQAMVAVLAPAVKGAALTLTAEGAGDAQPVAGNDTREGRAKNRRVALRVVGAAPAPETAQAIREEIRSATAEADAFFRKTTGRENP